MYKIFIVEDDEIIASAIEKHLEKWGYSALCAHNLACVKDEFDAFMPDLVLMDISLPFYNGYYWLQLIRKSSQVPVVFISSQSDNMNIIMAMNMGGDDFITKPFDLNVLMAKINAILRRNSNYVEKKPILEHRGAVLDVLEGSIVYGGEKLSLTRNELRILSLLLENKGKIVSREKLMEKLWETDIFIDENTLTVNIARLRKKLDSIELSGFITTKKGLGYIIEMQ